MSWRGDQSAVEAQIKAENERRAQAEREAADRREQAARIAALEAQAARCLAEVAATKPLPRRRMRRQEWEPLAVRLIMAGYSMAETMASLGLARTTGYRSVRVLAALDQARAKVKQHGVR